MLLAKGWITTIKDVFGGLSALDHAKEQGTQSLITLLENS